MKPLIVFVTVFALSTGVITSVADEAKPKKSPSLTEAQKKAVEDILLDNVKKLNRTLPIMVDAETRVDTSLAIGLQMHYKATMVDVSVDEIDSKKFLKVIEGRLIKSQLANKNVILFFNAGVEFFYSYFDKNGVLIGQIRINKAICGLE